MSLFLGDVLPLTGLGEFGNTGSSTDFGHIPPLLLSENGVMIGEDLKRICSDSLRYLFILLTDESILFEFKSKETYKILSHSVNLSTYSARVVFVLCIVGMVVGLFTINPSGYFS